MKGIPQAKSVEGLPEFPALNNIFDFSLILRFLILFGGKKGSTDTVTGLSTWSYPGKTHIDIQLYIQIDTKRCRYR